MSDLYAVLGVRRDANLAAIRRAFRKKVRDCHPDSGGSVDAFNELKAAYDVLSDALRRRRYDETGERDDRASIDPHQAKIIEALSAGLDQALLQLNASGGWRHADIMPATKKILAASLSEAERRQRGFEAARDQARALKDRFRQSEGDNLMEIVVARRISTCTHNIALLVGHAGVLKEAIAILMATDLEPYQQITDESGPQGAGTNCANTSSILDISSLIRFK